MTVRTLTLKLDKSEYGGYELEVLRGAIHCRIDEVKKSLNHALYLSHEMRMLETILTTLEDFLKQIEAKELEISETG